MKKYKFKLGEIVLVEDLECKVIEREVGEFDEGISENDYLCRPLDKTKMILGQSELGAGWVFERNIQKKVD